MAKGRQFNARRRGGDVHNVMAISADRITEIARKYWAPYTTNHAPFDPKIVTEIYEKEVVGSNFSQRKVVLLEFSHYLEAYLWKNFSPENSSNSYILSIVIMVNEKFRERIPAWQCFVDNPEHFPAFFRRVMEMTLDEENFTFFEQTSILLFLVNCFNSVEIDLIRQQIVKLCSLSIWINLLPSQRNALFASSPKLKKYWTKMEQKLEKMSDEEKSAFDYNRRFLWRMLQRFKRIVDWLDDTNTEFDADAVVYCERFLEFIIDLESLLTTRRFFNALLLASHLVIHCTISDFIQGEFGSLFCQLVTMVKFYSRFEIDDVTGQPLTNQEMTKRHYDHVTRLQKAAFKYFRDSMQDFFLLSVQTVDTRATLHKMLEDVSEEDLYKFAEFLHLVPKPEEKEQCDNYCRYDKTYLMEIIIFHCERRPNQLQQLNEQPLYPSEKVVWDENLVPYDEYDGESVLALNKLNLQFLTLHDYLLRNFNLFQLESTYEIRQDIEDVLIRMKPWKHESLENEVVWGGWARMALPLSGVKIVHVGKPPLGHRAPSDVKMDVVINLPKRIDLRQEWEGLRKHDVLFLITVAPTQEVGTRFDPRKPFKDQIKVAAIRGCEIDGLIGPDGRVAEEMEVHDVLKQLTGDSRTYRVSMDPNQYFLDTISGDTQIYFNFNLIIRRDPKTNNFKAVLSTIRQLLNTECVVPDWLHDLILGYGEPDSAHYSKNPNVIATLDLNDTFLSLTHVEEAFPGAKLNMEKVDPNLKNPLFRLTFKEFVPQHDLPEDERDKSIVVETYRYPTRGPYPNLEPKRSTIHFTPMQVEAIKSGMQPGLTIVVGPPGTGKTDVAVQIVSNIYHNWPEQRTLLVTHSNQALNQLFEKIMALDIDERHLLRLGHGTETLETEKDFSRYGRVNYVLAERLSLLKEVERLKNSMNEQGDVGYSCETAGHFYRYTVVREWDYFLERIDTEEAKSDLGSISKNFPFHPFFANAPQPLFKSEKYEEDLEQAHCCWRYIKNIFSKLEEFRAFELLRNGRDRTEYLLVKEAKIIAMTCTHAALRRSDLVALGFRYDNIIMEEAAQILEVETFIPLLLQDPHDGRNRLKRWIMIGDHHQLPPIVQNVAFQKYCNMEQSLFARFVRLGVPHMQLDAQGRARPEIAALYNWRYKNLSDLPHVSWLPQFMTINPGFLYNFQLIDVPDFNGVGENTPSPYFYQNLGEAEYVVALFTYMRILGYPAEKISIITTYNGQASLLNDVVRKRCADNPLIGSPNKISTVDKFQGQQNDYIILSLVRTKHVGHIRDVRRLVVALSRARLGLYVLGRASLFRNCYELTPAFNILCQRPTTLRLVPTEVYSKPRTMNEAPPMNPIEIYDTEHMTQFVHEFYLSNLNFLRAKYEADNPRIPTPPPVPAREELEPKKPRENLAETTVQSTPKVTSKDKEEAEQQIMFESVDFEKLENIPKP